MKPSPPIWNTGCCPLKGDEIYLVLDPGQDKVGVVLGKSPAEILWQGIVPRKELKDFLVESYQEHPSLILILGDGTTSEEVKKELRAAGISLGPVFWVDESFSTQEGRDLYFQENPPQGWQKLLPSSLRYPTRSIDDYAARILFQRFFLKKFSKKEGFFPGSIEY